MSFIETTSTEKGKNLQLYYEDYGEGQPVILIHGWPLSGQMWEYQVEEIVNAGYMCITYDRRGFGKSDRPWSGYDYDTLAKDLNDLITKLGLTDAIIVGFSMGGGEVARYIGNYGTSKLAKAALVSAVPPFMLKTDDNPEGLERDVFEGFKKEIRKDRPGFLAGFGKKFLNFEDHTDTISEDLAHFYWSIACSASPKATVDCVDSFGLTDFREDLKKIDIPILVIHGDADQIVPLELSGKKSNEILSQSTYEVIPDAPHGLVLTHTRKFNDLLLKFLKN